MVYNKDNASFVTTAGSSHDDFHFMVTMMSLLMVDEVSSAKSRLIARASWELPIQPRAEYQLGDG